MKKRKKARRTARKPSKVTVSEALRRARAGLDEAPLDEKHRANLKAALDEAAPGTELPPRDALGRFRKRFERAPARRDWLAAWIELPMRSRLMIAAPVLVTVIFLIVWGIL